MDIDFNTYFDHFSNAELHSRTVRLARYERKISMMLVHHLKEIFRRRTFAEMGYPNMVKYCIKELHLSETQANQRVSALNLIEAIPALSEKILDGKLSLTTVNQAVVFFNQVSKQENRKISNSEKRDILTKIEGMTGKETERELATISPHIIQVRDSKKYIAKDKILMECSIDQDVDEMLVKIKDLLSNSLPKNPTQNELLRKMAEIVLDQIDPVKKLERVEKAKVKREALRLKTNATVRQNFKQVPDLKLEQKPNRYTKQNPLSAASRIPLNVESQTNPKTRKPKFIRHKISVHTDRLIWRRDQSQCTYFNPITKKRCDQKAYLEKDHIIPLAKGGSNDPENLRLTCPAHNQLLAIKEFGIKKMSRYVKTLRSTENPAKL